MPRSITRELGALAFVVLLTVLCVLTCQQSVRAVDLPSYSVLTVSFSKLKVRDAPIPGYHIVEVPGTRPHLISGAPIVPVKVLVEKFPLNCRVRVAGADYEMRKVGERYRLLPAPRPRILEEEKRANYVEDPEIYNSPRPYPPEVVEWEVKKGVDPLTLERAQFLIVRVYPVIYIPRQRELYFVERVRIRVESVEAVGEVGEALQVLDLAIVASSSLESAAIELASLKNSTGLRSRVFTVEWIDSNFPGADLPEKVRNFVNYSVNEYGISYVLILGDYEVVPARRVYFDLDNENPVETDLYYADLQGTWDTDRDGHYGEPEDDVDGYPDVVVGRIPASTLDEARAVIGKIAAYSPDNSWFRRALYLGTVTFGDELHPEGEIVKDYVEYYGLLNLTWTKLYEGLGNLDPESVKAAINEGYGFVNFAGHGNVNVWSFGEGGTFTNADVAELANDNKTPVVATMSCLTADFGDTDVCIGEAFILRADGGAIAYFGATDVAYGFEGDNVIRGLAGEIDWRFLAAFKKLEEGGTTPTPGRIHVLALEEYLSSHGRDWVYDWYTVVEYGTLLGDCTIALRGTGNPPPPNPPQRLYGHVKDSYGNPAADARVWLYGEDGSLLASGKTDAAGYYEFVDPPPETCYMVVESRGANHTTSEFYYPHVDLERNITLPPSEFLPNTALLVLDDDASGCVDEGVWPSEFQSVLQALGFNVFTWSERDMGRPSLSTLLNKNVTLVVWHAGTYYNKVVDDVDSSTLMDFVDSGGRLLLEGEDIGYDHGNDTFMSEVAHAAFLADSVSAPSLETTDPFHPVINGTSEFPFGTTPPYPDGVEPVGGGEGLAVYKDTSYYSIIAYDGVPSGEGCRIVYLSFPVHYLNQSARETLLKNALKWLATSYYYETAANASGVVRGSWVRVTHELYNGTSPLPGMPVRALVYFPDGSLEGEYSMTDLGDGRYVLDLYIEEDWPTGIYRVRVESDIVGYGLVRDEVKLKVSESVEFEITLESVDVVEGVVHVSVIINTTASALEEAYFSIDGGDGVPAPPADGAFDEPVEEVVVEYNASQLAEGYHVMSIWGCALGECSESLNLTMHVRTLKPRYSIIALILRPYDTYMASDFARAVGPALEGVWKWVWERQDFQAYVPGVTEEDFEMVLGEGYFVYLEREAKFVEVGER